MTPSSGCESVFEREAADSGLLDVAFTTVDSPLGELLLAATPTGLVRVAFATEGLELVLDRLAAELSPRVLRAPKRLDVVARELDEYFSKRREDFDVKLDWALSRGFRRVVQSHLGQIGYGTTRSYRDVAELVGSPKAIRAVGSACATNPLPIIVPCHRVVRSDGSLEGTWGAPARRRCF